MSNEQLKEIQLAKNEPPFSRSEIVWTNDSASEQLKQNLEKSTVSRDATKKSPSDTALSGEKEIILPKDTQYTTSGDYKVLKDKIWGMNVSITGNSILLWNKMTEGSDNFDYIINLDNGRIKEAYNMQGNRGHIDENILTKIVEDLKKQGIDIDTAHNN